MSFKLIVRKKLRVPVKGTIPDEDGKPVKFDFVLHCKRLSQTQIDDVLADKGTPIREFLHDVAEGWEGVLQDDGSPLDFCTDNLDAVLEQAAMRSVCFESYLKEVGATSKN